VCHPFRREDSIPQRRLRLGCLRKIVGTAILCLTLTPNAVRGQVPESAPEEPPVDHEALLHTAEQSQPVLIEVPFSRAFLDSVTYVSDPRFFSPTRFVFADPREYRLHVVDVESGAITRLGGHGSGPGEFQSCSTVSVLLDGSIIVWDARLMRMTVFEPDGKLEGSVHLEMTVPAAVGIAQIDRGQIAVLPLQTMLSGANYDRVLLLSRDLALLESFEAPCSGRVAAIEDAYDMAMCARTIGRGEGGTILLGESFTYTIRRYDVEGSMLEEFVQLDPDFKPPDSEVRDRGEGNSPLVIMKAKNGLSHIEEIAGRGLVVGGWFHEAREGFGSVWAKRSFVDFRDLEGKLIRRVPLETDYELGDVLEKDGMLYLLVSRQGVNEVADLRILSCPVGSISWL